MSFRLERKVAVITGGARGIGAETARVFREAGATVVTWDVSEGADERVDVTDLRAVQTAVTEVVATHQRIDILVNNAGILRDAQLVRVKDGEIAGGMSEAEFDAVIAVNLRGVFACTQAVAPVMIRQRYGRILNASSVVGLYGNFGQTNYVATKAAVIGMTKVWARELGPRGITVNAVAPGFIGTEMVRQMPEKILATMVERTPLRRLGEPRDVANAYLFLASDEAGFINGAVLSVDGGVVVGT
ncbi:MAG: SDR family oxidoreductase [Chloroflexi bacterium]|nr:MAG: SDR family oxidoreductase [Chloroflexota bacterium]TMF67446.1 MAG: SDR family oxidoreductase [Chloroflexota bacterium]TMG36374.1 MAG: SDR family oxidoreductase [Chloroflexota bacterium]TMG40353.1 MAG: SDR family oxidoreductase [Chloroflexota bacterium]